MEEPEAKPQNLTEDIEKKKHKKPKKISPTNNPMTGFEEAFQQFATSGIKKEKKAVVSPPPVVNPATQRPIDIPAESKPDISTTQVSFSSSKLMDLSFEL